MQPGKLVLVLGCLCLPSQVLGVAVTGRKVPQLEMLRRHIPRYGAGREGSVTIVFRASDPDSISVRWFREANTRLPYAEVPDMVTVEGDTNYVVTSLRSGSVVATTLTVKHKHVPRDIATSYTTVFDVADWPMQYMLDTPIDGATANQMDFLNGSHWIRIPPPTMTYMYKGRFSVRCGVIVDSEERGTTPTLSLYKNYFERTRRNTHGASRMLSDNLRSVNKELSTDVQRSGRFTYRGTRRLRGAGGRFKYDASVVVTNATRDDEGMYACGMERNADRTYVSTWVGLETEAASPRVELVSCENKVKKKQRNNIKMKVTMTHGQETCYRCRAQGQPLPKVQVYRSAQNMPEGSLVMSDGWVQVDAHVNVADGGLAELTLTYLRPSDRRHRGDYRCVAQNQHGRAHVDFSVDVER